MEGLTEPVALPTRRLLRRAVLDHATVQRGRTFAPVLHVGRPGARVARFPVAVPLNGSVNGSAVVDPGLAADVVAAMRCRAGAGRDGEPLVWLTRPGGLELQDLDARWLAAARAAYAEAGASLTFVVANKHGWRDPRSGAGQTWARLRRAPGA